jgi:hypothetical protein
MDQAMVAVSFPPLVTRDSIEFAASSKRWSPASRSAVGIGRLELAYLAAPGSLPALAWRQDRTSPLAFYSCRKRAGS